MANMTLDQQTQAQTVATYCSLVIGAVVLTTCASFAFYYTSLRASKRLHDNMVTAVLKSPVSFFDKNPSGRIMNRFSKDVGVMDDLLPARMLRLLQFSLYSLCAVLVPSVANYWVFIALLPMAAVFVYYGLFYLRSSRDFKRLEATKCSPVYSHMAETVAGLEVIRSNQREGNFLCQFHRWVFFFNLSLAVCNIQLWALAKRGHTVAATLCPAMFAVRGKTRRHCCAPRADTRNVSEHFQKHFVVSATNVARVAKRGNIWET